MRQTRFTNNNSQEENLLIYGVSTGLLIPSLLVNEDMNMVYNVKTSKRIRRTKRMKKAFFTRTRCAT
jgi:hypothetical protein